MDHWLGDAHPSALGLLVKQGPFFFGGAFLILRFSIFLFVHLPSPPGTVCPKIQQNIQNCKKLRIFVLEFANNRLVHFPFFWYTPSLPLGEGKGSQGGSVNQYITEQMVIYKGLRVLRKRTYEYSPT